MLKTWKIHRTNDVQIRLYGMALTARLKQKHENNRLSIKSRNIIKNLVTHIPFHITYLFLVQIS